MGPVMRGRGQWWLLVFFWLEGISAGVSPVRVAPDASLTHRLKAANSLLREAPLIDG